MRQSTRRLVAPLLALSALFVACRKPATSPNPAPPSGVTEKVREIRIGEKFSLSSRVLKEERPYWIYVPDSYKGGARGGARYPVLYLLDGDRHFHSATGVAGFLADVAAIPEMIVVAIPNTDRDRDMTPTHSVKGYSGEDDPSKASSGGADAFLGFLQTELIPRIDADYRTLPYRVLAGHSAGGLFALHAFVKAPAVFQAVVAMDPSLWWDGSELVNRASRTVPQTTGLRNSIFISAANHPPSDREDPRTASDAIRNFSRLLEGIRSPTLRSRLEYFEHETHQSLTLLSLYQGLLFVFDGYKFPIEEAVAQPSLIAAHFRKLSDRLGAEFQPPEALLGLVAYTLLYEKKDIGKAIEVLELTVRAYPNSSQALDHLAEGYVAKGDTALAVASYKRALELDPKDEDAITQLGKLTKPSR
jgi:predicted alpha/beta superfamily hydrolase